MKKWNTYKKTFRTEPDLFDFARTGDLRGLADTLTHIPDTDVNAKNSQGYSAQMLAVYNGQKDFCEALLRCGAEVNSIDSVGNTLLMAAAFKGDLNMIKLLLQFNADVAIENKSKMTVRDWALMFKRDNIVQYLDSLYPVEKSTTKTKNILRFIKLTGYLLINKFQQRFS